MNAILQVESISILDVEVEIFRKDIKNIHLRVYPPEGFVRATVPFDMDRDAIRLFLVKKISWIRKQQEDFRKVERQTPRDFLRRESHYFLGLRYLLDVVESNEKQQVVQKNKKTLVLQMRPEASHIKAQEIMDAFYRNELKLIVSSLIEKWEPILKVQVSDWQVKKMRTRWGTCNHEKGRILINLELAKKPPHCIEYILVHEMVHLLERTHNEHFIELMDSFLPNWRALKHELNSLPVSHADWNY